MTNPMIRNKDIKVSIAGHNTLVMIISLKLPVPNRYLKNQNISINPIR